MDFNIRGTDDLFIANLDSLYVSFEESDLIDIVIASSDFRDEIESKIQHAVDDFDFDGRISDAVSDYDFSYDISSALDDVDFTEHLSYEDIADEVGRILSTTAEGNFESLEQRLTLLESKQQYLRAVIDEILAQFRRISSMFGEVPRPYVELAEQALDESAAAPSQF